MQEISIQIQFPESRMFIKNTSESWKEIPNDWNHPNSTVSRNFVEY